MVNELNVLKTAKAILHGALLLTPVYRAILVLALLNQLREI